ncbi:hypothetical protein CLI75_12190, partial [Porphyromonas gingivalis]
FSLTEQQLRSPRAILMAEGLDTYATVLLNGKKIMESRNMFVGTNECLGESAELIVQPVGLLYDSLHIFHLPVALP